MRILLLLSIGLAPSLLLSQDTSSLVLEDSSALIWVKELYEPGLKLEKDSIYISDEFRKLISDKDYYLQAFPEKYEWRECMILIRDAKYKLSFWYMLNLYSKSEKDKELVMRSMLAYSKIFDMEAALNSVLFTYPMADPRICKIKDGIPEVVRPDIFEGFRNIVIKLIYAIDKYSESQEN